MVFNGDTPDDFTIWDALFILKNHNCNRWCDVEYEISESFKLISNMEICLWDKTYIFLKDGVSSLIEEGNSCKLLIIEKQLALIAYSLFFKGKIDEVEIDDFYEFLLEHLNKFEKRFAQYVSELTDWKYYAEAELLLKKLLFLDNGATNNVVLSFNYTDLHELDKKCYWSVLSNVHGTITSKPVNIIFGIDDLTIQTDKYSEYCVRFSKSYRKMHNLYLNSTLNVTLLSENIDRIIFYGHSLNKADYSYFQSIFDYYHIYSSSVELWFCYADFIGYDSNHFIKSIYDLINDYGKTLDNSYHGKNLFHKLLLEDRIKTIKIDKEDV